MTRYDWLRTMYDDVAAEILTERPDHAPGWAVLDPDGRNLGGVVPSADVRIATALESIAASLTVLADAVQSRRAGDWS